MKFVSFVGEKKKKSVLRATVFLAVLFGSDDIHPCVMQTTVSVQKIRPARIVLGYIVSHERDVMVM